MQKRKFSLQNFEGGRALSREEMKNVLGGVAAQPASSATYNYECQCSAIAGETSAVWYGNYSSDSAANAALSDYCPHGGGCRAGSYTNPV